MKLRFISVCLLLGSLSPGWTQGTIDIGNSLLTAFQTNNALLGTNGNARGSGPGSFFFEVLTAPSTVTTLDASLQGLLSSPWSDTGVSGTNIVIPGRENGSTNGVALNWALGSTQSFVVVGWSANEGTTWAQVSSKLAGASLDHYYGGFLWDGGGLVPGGFLGATTVGQAGSGPAAGPGPLLFNALPSVTTELYLVDYPIPEPGAVALSGLGAALLIGRRGALLKLCRVCF